MAQPLPPQRHIVWNADGSRAGSLDISTEPAGDTAALPDLDGAPVQAGWRPLRRCRWPR